MTGSVPLVTFIDHDPPEQTKGNTGGRVSAYITGMLNSRPGVWAIISTDDTVSMTPARRAWGLRKWGIKHGIEIETMCRDNEVYARIAK